MEVEERIGVHIDGSRKFPIKNVEILEKFPIFISGRIDIISLDSNRFYRYDDTYFR